MLDSMLKESIVNVRFRKANGEIRTMYATLNTNYIIPTSGGNSTHNDEVYTVIDTEINQWRRFRKDSIIDYKVHEYV